MRVLKLSPVLRRLLGYTDPGELWVDTSQFENPFVAAWWPEGGWRWRYVVNNDTAEWSDDVFKRLKRAKKDARSHHPRTRLLVNRNPTWRQVPFS